MLKSMSYWTVSILIHRVPLAAYITTRLAVMLRQPSWLPEREAPVQALQLSGNITNGVSENAGVNSPDYTPSNNTDPSLSDYTLSFDMAITHGANSGVGVTLNIFGTGAADGSSYGVPISQITVGGGFQHFSVNMGTLPAGYQIPALNPTDSQYSFQLLFLGYNASVTATPETILLDNLQITVVSNTNPYPNPPPSGTNTTAPHFNNPPIYADYPDPDIIRVGNDFYFTTTTFIDVPGLTVLHSQDLVHWEIVTHLIPQLTGSPNYNITNGVQNYRNGVFASSIRYYNGTFYVVDQPNGQPTATIFYSTNIAGPWQSHQLNVGAFDPGLYHRNQWHWLHRYCWRLAKQYHNFDLELHFFQSRRIHQPSPMVWGLKALMWSRSAITITYLTRSQRPGISTFRVQRAFLALTRSCIR